MRGCTLAAIRLDHQGGLSHSPRTRTGHTWPPSSLHTSPYARCGGICLHACIRKAVCHGRVVTKRRNSWACIGNPNPEQETIKGTHAQETPAYQRRPTTQYGARKQPPNWALHMQLAKIPHTQQTTPPATRAASAGQHGTHRGRNRYHLPSQHTHN